MNNKDIEKMLSSVNLEPSSSVKQRVLGDVLAMPSASKTETVKKKRFSLRKLTGVIMASLMLLVMVGAGVNFGLYNENYTTVYVDINPSVEISINRFSVVNEVTYLNKDAEELFSNVSLKGKKADQALDAIMEVLNENEYLKDGAELYISGYSSKDDDYEKQVDKLCERAERYNREQNKGINVNKEELKKEDVKRGKKNKMSPVKNKIIDDIVEMDGNQTLEDLRDSSMEDLKNHREDLWQQHGFNGGFGEDGAHGFPPR